MSLAIGDPEELVRFSNILQRYLENISTETDQLLSAFNQLSDSWKDQQSAKFDEDLKELISRLEIFKENASEKIPYLRRMAEDLENYLGR